MKSTLLIILFLNALMSLAVEAKVNEPGSRDPGDLANPQVEIQRQKEEAERQQKALNARTLNKKREIEEQTIALLSESGDVIEKYPAIVEKLDEIVLGDVAIEEVQAFREAQKLKLKNALLDKKALLDERSQDEVLNHIKL